MLSLAATAQETQPDCSSLEGSDIRWIMPYSAGGSFDIYSRTTSPFIAKRLGAKIVVHRTEGTGGLLGALEISRAKPDGRTIGIVNGATMMLALFAGEENAPDPLTEFTILARITRAQRLWVVAESSGIRTFDDLVRLSEKRPILISASNVTGGSFAAAALGCGHLMRLPNDVILGYQGNRASGLAALRGEVDMFSGEFRSLSKRIGKGELRAVVQIGTEPIAKHPALEGVPTLGGPDGVAAQRAKALGLDVERAIQDADALDKLLGAGRLVVGPAGLDDTLTACLVEEMHAALTSDECREAVKQTKRTFDPVKGAPARQTLVEVQDSVKRLAPILRQDLLRGLF